MCVVEAWRPAGLLVEPVSLALPRIFDHVSPPSLFWLQIVRVEIKTAGAESVAHYSLDQQYIRREKLLSLGLFFFPRGFFSSCASANPLQPTTDTSTISRHTLSLGYVYYTVLTVVEYHRRRRDLHLCRKYSPYAVRHTRFLQIGSYEITNRFFFGIILYV